MRIVSLTAFLVMFTTIAQASGYYAGIVGGQSEFESDHISAGKGTTIDTKSSAGYIFFGREFDDNIAVEGFYANLGEMKLSGKPGNTYKVEGEDYVFNDSTSFTATLK